jgi:hypothetical protein
MIKKRNYIPLFFMLFGLLTSCNQITIKVDSVPANTPEGAQLFIAGNFNNWNPSDPNFIMNKKDDSTFFTTLPYGFGTMEYKITRGSWESVETDECGHSIDNKRFKYGATDTIITQIKSWNDKEPLDCPRLTIIIDSVPKNTPDSAEITIAGNFNEWNPIDETYKLLRNSKGGYQITMMKPKSVSEIEFKFTRGDLNKIEADKYGNEIPNRLLKFGLTDTIVTSVKNWEDLSNVEDKFVTIILEDVPAKTYDSDNLYLVGNFNGWYPKDKTYKFEKLSNGKYMINLPRKDGKLEFKVTRGSWETQELDATGSIISNREYKYKNTNEILITIDNWADRLPAKKLIFVVYKYPDYTHENDEIYITGNFNGWDAHDSKFKMTKTSDGKFIKEVEIDEKRVEYKFTRGGWATEETNEKGYKIDNRIHRYIGIDTIYVSIKNWLDLNGFKGIVTFVIDEVPNYTPESDNIYFVSNINNWYPRDKNYIMEKKDNKYFITIEFKQHDIYYKFTRGPWKTVEGNRSGGEINNRHLYYNYQDTIYHQIKSWKDLHLKK